METIKLLLQGNSWVAYFKGGELDGEIIPTAYTAAAPADWVVNEIERLNPGSAVSLMYPA